MTQRYERRATLIKIEGMHAERGDRLVLRDIDVEVKDIVRPDVADQGQVVGVLGPSGAGKTTLLRVLAGLDARAAAGYGSVGPCNRCAPAWSVSCSRTIRCSSTAACSATW